MRGGGGSTEGDTSEGREKSIDTTEHINSCNLFFFFLF